MNAKIAQEDFEDEKEDEEVKFERKETFRREKS